MAKKRFRDASAPNVSEDWLNFSMQPDGRMPRIVQPEGSVVGKEKVGKLMLHHIEGAIDEGNLTELQQNLVTLGVLDENEIPPNA